MGVLAYVKRVLVAFDQFANTVAGGYPDETISSRWGRNMDNPGHPVAKVGARVLDAIQTHHTSSALEHDKARAEVVEAVEKEAGA